MTLIHKKCGSKLVSSGIGDWGLCNICKTRVDHLIYDGSNTPVLSAEVEVISDD